VEGRLLIESALVLQDTRSSSITEVLVSESGACYVISSPPKVDIHFPASWRSADKPGVVRPPICKQNPDDELEVCGRYSVHGTIFAPFSVSLPFTNLTHARAGKIILTGIDDLEPPAKR